MSNVVIYSTWPKASQEMRWDDPKAAKLWEAAQQGPKGHRKRLRNKLKKHHGVESHYLGGDIIIDRKKACEGNNKTRGGQPLTVRIPVAGHWRHYWVRVGSCRSRAKIPELRRIRPGWRGPEGAPLSKKERKLK